MSAKRSRAAYESDLAPRGAPFVFFGTPVLQTTGTGDGGNYIPLHNQEVRDDRGRRRLHGAFTGGWSAGYFNTVGSREGWAPSQFRSSRGNRHEADPARVQSQPQDFMDEEDLLDAAASQKLSTSQSFSGIGGRNHDSQLTDKFMGLLHVKSETAGVLLLKRMGWKDGQGIGPKAKRKPRLGIRGEERATAMSSSYLFAPDDTAMIPFSMKTDRGGLGLHNHDNLTDQYLDKTGADNKHKGAESQAFSGPCSTSRALHTLSSSRGFGVGILNDSSSGEDDPYEIGPKISRIRRVRNPKKTKPPTGGHGTAQVSSSDTMRGSRSGGGCYDEHNPLGEFVRGTAEDGGADMASVLQSSFPVPEWWAPSRRPAISSAGKNTRIHPGESNSASRGRMLGESEILKHKDVAGHSESVQSPKVLPSQIPQPTRQAAEAALGRERGGGPYQSQALKRERYRRYLEYHAGLNAPAPTKPDGMADPDFSQELAEFYSCVAIFKPMVAPMASRFTAASASAPTTRSEAATEASNAKDTSREAARLGMFGDMTRSTVDFTPSSLLCKRFNVMPPRPNASTEGVNAQPLGTSIDSSSKGQAQERQDRPVTKNRGIIPFRDAFGEEDTIGSPARHEHISEQVFDAIFGGEG